MLSQKIGFNKGIVYSQLNLGLAYLRLGEQLSRQAGVGAGAPGAIGVDHFGLLWAITYLGWQPKQLANQRLPSERFAEAWQRLDALDMYGNGQDAKAGLARCHLRPAETAQALEHTRRVWEYLMQNGSQALEFPILAYQTCAQVFNAAGDLGQRRRMPSAAAIRNCRSAPARSATLPGGKPSWKISPSTGCWPDLSGDDECRKKSTQVFGSAAADNSAKISGGNDAKKS